MSDIRSDYSRWRWWNCNTIQCFNFGASFEHAEKVDVDFALLEEGDHMYNGHLVDLYKVAGNYIIGAVQRRTPLKKRRGRRKKIEMEQDNLLLEDNSMEAEDDFVDEPFDDEEE